VPTVTGASIAGGGPRHILKTLSASAITGKIPSDPACAQGHFSRVQRPVVIRSAHGTNLLRFLAMEMNIRSAPSLMGTRDKSLLKLCAASAREERDMRCMNGRVCWLNMD
jgi:hypothetical protein